MTGEEIKVDATVSLVSQLHSNSANVKVVVLDFLKTNISVSAQKITNGQHTSEVRSIKCWIRLDISSCA